MVGLSTAPVLSWIILLAPLCAAVLILLVGVHRRELSAGLSIGTLLLSFACAAWLFLHSVGHHDALPFETSVAWMAFSLHGAWPRGRGVAIEFRFRPHWVAGRPGRKRVIGPSP